MSEYALHDGIIELDESLVVLPTEAFPFPRDTVFYLGPYQCHTWRDQTYVG